MARKRTPARTLDGQETRLISLANDLAEKQLMDGTASPSVIAYYLKLGSPSAELEREKLSLENELTRAKTENIQSTRRQEELVERALTAIRSYRGIDEEYDDY